ncbi:MAG: hypothetical protein MI757_18960 [Pirellulales bacterium]|nr:hypothetical protein [Pirellulales bacterium]
MISNRNDTAGDGPRTVIDGIIHFDATDVRRTKMRESALRRRGGNAAAKPPEVQRDRTTERSTEQQSPAETQQDVPPLERPGVISLVPLANVALAPSPHGATVPAVQPTKETRD